MLRIAPAVMSHCLELFEDALKKDSVDKLSIEKVMLERVQLINLLDVLNIRNCSFPRLFFQSGTDVNYICLRASTLRALCCKRIWLVWDFLDTNSKKKKKSNVIYKWRATRVIKEEKTKLDALWNLKLIYFISFLYCKKKWK